MSIIGRYYGKANVRVMHVERSGMYQVAKEIRVNAFIVLNSDVDYQKGDNCDVVPTDTVKNTIYFLAKKHGVKNIETFALQVTKTIIEIEEGEQEHSHAFISGKETGTRFCKLTQDKGGKPSLTGGLKNMRVLKTTQSGFVGFHRDQYTTLPDVADRIFSTIVYATYDFSSTTGVDFDAVAKVVKDSIIFQFAGPVSTGLFSPSVQKTMFDAGKDIVARVPQISVVELQMPNMHYMLFDMTRLGVKNNTDVFYPIDDPNGFITIKVGRETSKL